VRREWRVVVLPRGVPVLIEPVKQEGQDIFTSICYGDGENRIGRGEAGDFEGRS
jgi:hypothetical protein